MPRIEVFDPPMCCNTGVCGPDPQDHLTRFAADLKWLADQGAEVRRYNLAQEPAAFMANPRVKQIVDETAGDGLPIVIIDGRVVSQQEYPSRHRLTEWIAQIAQVGQAAVGTQRHATAEPSPDTAKTPGGCCGGTGSGRCC